MRDQRFNIDTGRLEFWRRVMLRKKRLAKWFESVYPSVLVNTRFNTSGFGLAYRTVMI